MLALENILNQSIAAYNVTLSNNISFWAPYLINLTTAASSTVPRGMGKASPEEIRKSAEYILALFPHATGEEIRKKLVSGELPDPQYNYKGVDCSGFLYHILSRTLRSYNGCDLDSILTVPKEDVLNGAYNFEEWKAAYSLGREEAAALPENVPLAWVASTFKRQARNLCRVKSFLDPAVSKQINPRDIRMGDLLYTTYDNSPIPHIMIVTDATESEITLFHTGRKDPEDIGGVSEVKFTRANDGSPLLSHNPHAKFEYFCRLHALDS